MDSTLTVAEVAAVVESEGLDYSIRSYLNPDRIADPELRQLWQTARHTLDAIEARLAAASDGAAQRSHAGLRLSGPLRVRHAELLLAAVPPLFEGAPTDQYGCLIAYDGRACLNRRGGRFGTDPELYLDGEFAPDELRALLAAITPHLASHVTQTATLVDGDGGKHTLGFPRGGGTELDHRPFS